MKNQVRKIKENIFYIVLFVVLFLYVVSMLTPMAWGIITALKTQQEFRINVLGLPKGAPWEWQWGNFIAVTDGLYTQITTEEGRFYVGFFPSLVNTLTYAGGGALIRAIVPCVIGYVTAKFDYKFN